MLHSCRATPQLPPSRRTCQKKDRGQISSPPSPLLPTPHVNVHFGPRPPWLNRRLVSHALIDVIPVRERLDGAKHVGSGVVDVSALLVLDGSSLGLWWTGERVPDPAGEAIDERVELGRGEDVEGVRATKGGCGSWEGRAAGGDSGGGCGD